MSERGETENGRINEGIEKISQVYGTWNGKCGEPGNSDGMGAEEKKSGQPDFCGFARPFRASADCI